MVSKLRNLKSLSSAFSLFTVLITCSVIYAAPGDLDLTFNGTGKRVDGFGSGNDEIYAAALQANGKIVVVGRSSFGSQVPAVAARYNPDGSFDNSFNGSGKILLTSAMATAYATAIQPDGKIVIAGVVYSGQYTDFALVRLNSDGTFDNTFGNNGKISTPIGLRHDIAYSLAIQSDGKIIAAGTDENPNLSGFYEFALVRYNSDGSLDHSFGLAGKVTTLFPSSSGARSIIIQSDGKIVVAGSGNHSAIIARYNPDGSLDTAFGSNGSTSLQFYRFNSVTLQSDNKIVAAGSPTVSSIDFTVVRFNSDGTLDSTFDGDGIATVPDSFGTDTAYAVKVGTNGKISATGDGGGYDFVAIRFNTDGSLDAGFGNAGKVSTLPAADRSYPNAALLQPDGKLIIAGHAEIFFGLSDFALIRYNVNGTLDTTFDTDGKVLNDVGEATMYVAATAIQSDRKIVVAGHHFVPGSTSSNWNFAVFRYNSDGSLDTTFDGDGKLSVGFFDNIDDYATSVVIQPDGKIIVAGYLLNGSFTVYAIVRLNQDGSFDNSFDGDGKVFTDVGIDMDFGNSVALQPDGKIIVGGYTGSGNSNAFSAVRYNPDGSLDTSFNGSGKVVTTIEGGNARANSVAIQTDGKVILVGYAVVSGNVNFVLVRYNANGTLDTSFGNEGKVLTLPGNNPGRANSAVILPDGKILVGGSSISDFALARYNSAGTLDTSFNSNGIVITPLNGEDQITGLTIQPDGKIIAAGFTSTLNNYNYATLRYNSDGSLDNSWGNSGKVITDISGVEDKAQAVALDSSGKVVVAGRAGGLVSIVRYNGDTPLISQRKAFDFDGDGKSDVSVFRPSASNWYLLQSQAGFSAAQFGNSNDLIAPADFDGDGKTDIAVFRPSDGAWYRLNSSNNQFVALQFGQNGDLPRPGDFDGDGRADIAVFRPSTGAWYWLNSSNGQFNGVQFGANGDIPLVADFDGDGKSDISVFRPSTGSWYWLNSSNRQFSAIAFGANGDVPTAADYDGDGKSDVSVFRPSTGSWYRLNSSNGQFIGLQFGQNGDVPAATDFDGDGKADIAVFRDGSWYILQSQAGFTGVQFGANADKPIPAAFLQ